MKELTRKKLKSVSPTHRIKPDSGSSKDWILPSQGIKPDSGLSRDWILPRCHCDLSKRNHIIKSLRKENVDVEKDKCNNDVDCICHSKNILTRPADFEETCFIFTMTNNWFGIDSETLLSLKGCVTEIIYPFAADYDFHRLNYNHKFNFYPVAIVRAHKVSDIVNTIKFCRINNLPLRARGGAHSYEPASLVNFGIILDQRPRDKIIKIDRHNKVVKIQSGALLGPLVNKLSDQNMLIPFGTCVTNGLAGLTLGGGIGFSIRKYGLTLDQVLDIKIVLADGSVTNANSIKNNDLYWALRGAGGGNFGIVTDFLFKYETVEWVTIFTLYFNFNDTKEILKIWQLWAPFTDVNLTSEFDIFNKYQPVIVTGQLLPGFNPESDKKLLLTLIKPLLILGLHTNLSIKTMSIKESAQYFGQGSYSRPLFFKNKSDFNFDPLPDAAIDIIINYMSLLDASQSHNKTEINALGGNFAKVSDKATAFPSRSAKHWIQYTSLWDTTDQQEKSELWIKEYYAALRPFFPKKRTYVNALDYDIKPSLRAVKSYYGNNLFELIKIKNKYDPTNFFKFEQSIPSLSDFDTK